uniref:ShKT domain-containing protein n=1 Tax=Meloidogyne incognita TaxID=6306 RepID=A0A914NKL8_MELIC
MSKIYPKNLLKIFTNIIFYFIFSISSGKECADKNFPGRASDCPMLKYLCERALYKDIMSKECPRTCDLCDLFKINLCSDNISPNGISECPKFKERCNDKIWGDFMKKECRVTCGTCKQFIYDLKNGYESKSKMKIKKEKIGAGKYIFLHTHKCAPLLL